MRRAEPQCTGEQGQRRTMLTSETAKSGFARPHRLIVFLSVVLSIGFLATSLTSFYVSKTSIRDAIIHHELPLTTDNIYSEIQKDLVRPVFISSMMASDTFLRDWVLAGELDPNPVHKYLNDVQTRSNAFTSFFVSDRTLRYYYGNGNRKVLSTERTDDDWYFRVRQLDLNHELNVDYDRKISNHLIVFVNHRMFDYAGQYIGITGVGITVNDVQALIGDYQARYQRSVYFIDENGQIVLSGDPRKPLGARLADLEGLSQLQSELTRKPSGAYQYTKANNNYLLNVRYIPELKWYLVVEKNEADATASIRNTLYVNLMLCVLITGCVLLFTHLAIRRYQRQIERLSNTDQLTGLPNRNAFEQVVYQLSKQASRQQQPLSLLLGDVDFFKAINDQHGHLAGDAALKTVADVLKHHLRASDFICRWGGEKFLVILRGCDAASAYQVAEHLREAVERSRTVYQQHHITLTMSLGSATQQSGESVEQWLLRADQHLYDAKHSGRNQVRPKPLESVDIV